MFFFTIFTKRWDGREGGSTDTRGDSSDRIPLPSIRGEDKKKKEIKSKFKLCVNVTLTEVKRV